MKKESIVTVMNRLSLLFQAILSLLVYFIIEAASRHSAAAAWVFMTKSPLVFLYNAFMIFMTMMFVYLFRKRTFVRALIAGLWLILGIVNGIVLANRVTPLTGPDFKLIFDAAEVLGAYMSPLKVIGAAAGLAAVVAGMVILFRKAPKFQGKMHYLRNAGMVAAVCLLFGLVTHLALNNRVLSSYFGNIAFAYEDYGFPYCFTSTLFGTGMDAPHDYSDKSIRKILSSEGEVKETMPGDMDFPNIIFVQLESFFDPKEVEFLEMSEDPIPNFRALMQKYSSGYYKVPSVGAGTANTEFETITGMNLRDFGPGEYPYKTILQKTTCESMAYVLKELGYGTHAIHNNTASFYDRRDVFSKLGFDTFTSREMMDIKEMTPNGWPKDEILVECILDALKATPDQDYVFTITVQSHGDYPEEPLLENPKIKVSGPDTEGQRNAWEYYVNQIYEVDAFVGHLVEALEAYGEDTVLFLYGDHLPTMGLKVNEVKSRYLFETEYVIWDNIGLAKKDQTLTAYQAGAEVLKQIGIQKGTIFTYHQTRRKTKHYLGDLQELQYDMLYGKQYVYGQESPYEPTDLQMGVKPVIIDQVFTGHNGNVYVQGENFTENSRIVINGEQVETLFINSGVLRPLDVKLKSGDLVQVQQVSSKNTLLYSSGEWAYR